MPWAGQQPMHAPPPAAGPALFLYPTNDSFVPKMISLTPSGNRVKIGRQTNTKTVPGERNGYFDSKVLSRQHAEVWEEGGKIFIKDVKSSNGTFVNGERLSVEGMESEPWELKSDDRVEFGIDIVGEDNKTIIHHKVAATVFCVITAEDYAQISMHHPPLQHHANGAYHLQPGQQQRRPSLQQAQSPVGLGGLGGGPGLGLSGRTGKSGLTFDHILNRLQNELQKSRETHSELNSLATVMTDISDNLSGGALPPSIPSAHSLPPVRPPPPPSDAHPSSSESSVELSALQSQIIQTQSALATHADKVKTLEGVLAEHEHVKREVQLMRDLMEQRKMEMETLISHSRLRVNGGSPDKSTNHDLSEDDDDTRSILTITPDESEESHPASGYTQEEQDTYDEERARTEAMGRPRTPEPHGMGMAEDDEDETDSNHHSRRQFDASTVKSPPNFTSGFNSSSHDEPSHNAEDPSHLTTRELQSQNVQLSSRLETLAQQLDSALSLSRTLHTQTEAAQKNIDLLEAKVRSLETFVETTKAQQQQQEVEAAAAKAAAATAEVTPAPQYVLSEVWETWRQRVEGQWRVEREEWESERLRLQQAVRDWEIRMAEVEQREERRSTQSEELFASMRREREEVSNHWRRLHDAAEQAALERSFVSADVEDDNLEAPRLTNGALATKSSASNPKLPRGSIPASKSKKRRSAQHVATPPHSPTMNGGIITEQSSEASGSRSSSPDLSSRSAFSNGHIKPELLPLSPAPSLRNGGMRTGSASSEPDTADDVSVVPSVGQLSSPSVGADKQQLFRSVRLRESPLPYISASVFFIGLAAWAFASRAKD